jgi:hypothetical protein
MRRCFAIGRSTTPWIALGALLLGYVLGAAGSFDRAGAVGARQATNQASPAGSDAAATSEVGQLQTRVAELPTAAVCTPAPRATATPVPSPTATPTAVPPAAAGEAVTYGDGWTITITSLYLTPTIGAHTADGIFALVGMTITNDGREERSFRFADLRLQDAAGRVFRPAGVFTGTYWTSRFAPGMPTDATIAFDVAVDTGEWFIVQSEADPTFRVQVAPSRLG